MLPVGALLAAQAAGMIFDYFGTQSQNEMAQEAAERQQEAIGTSIAVTRLQTEDASLRALVQLRQNLGTQAAIFAARGVRAGTGTSVIAGNESVSNFNADERMRRMNQLMNEKRLQAGLDISKMQQKTFENNNWNAFTGRVINRIPTDPDVIKKYAQGFGFTSAEGS